MMKINKEIRKLSQSFQYAIRGLRLCARHERNFRIHITAACYVTVCALIVQLPITQYAVLCLCFALMMCAELLNTAIERWCDMDSGGYNVHVRDAKDIAAAAVFVCAVFCVIIGLLFFGSQGRLWKLLAFFLLHQSAFLLLILSIPLSLAFVFGLLYQQ